MNRSPFLLVPVLILLSCKPPLAPIEGQEITRITVYPLQYGKLKGRKTAVLTERSEIQFVVKSLSGLKARGYDHSMPEFDLILETSTGSHLKLRVSDSEVGPDAPASDNNTHWFPRDTKAFKVFYDFLWHQTQPNP